MRTRKREARPAGPAEMDLEELAWTGLPPEDWPRLLAAALMVEVEQGRRADIALPGEQAEAVAGEISRMLEEEGWTARVLVSPHRLGWHRVRLDADRVAGRVDVTPPRSTRRQA